MLVVSFLRVKKAFKWLNSAHTTKDPRDDVPYIVGTRKSIGGRNQEGLLRRKPS